MKQLISRVLSVYSMLERAEFLPRLAARLCVGLMFLGGAVKKGQNLSDFIEYFKSLHIPAPELQAPFVVGVEFFGGLALMLGLLTRPAAFLLSGTMVVALATAAIPDHKIQANWKGLLEFLYLPETLLLLILGWLLFAGAGRISLDHHLRQKLEK